MLEIRNIQKRFDSQTALESISLTIHKGEFFSLLGPSGCGKSTLLRILAGLENATRGEIYWDGKRIDGFSARLRPFNMVFQKYALFPHLTVSENIAFGLRLKRLAAKEIQERVAEALELVNLKGYSHRLPETLSGGQAQRVALARALANRPACVLLDEPLAALDQKLREHMQTELRILQKRLGLTFIFVTHDQEEAMLLSDRIAVMVGGRIEQVAPPRQLYEAPGSVFCARFVGRRNELSGRLLGATADFVRFCLDEIPGSPVVNGRLIHEARPSAGLVDTGPVEAGPEDAGRAERPVRLRAFVSPERIRLVQPASGKPPTPDLNVVEGEVLQVLFRGTQTEAVVGFGDSVFIRCLIDSRGPISGWDGEELTAGERVQAQFPSDKTHVYFARGE